MISSYQYIYIYTTISIQPYQYNHTNIKQYNNINKTLSIKHYQYIHTDILLSIFIYQYFIIYIFISIYSYLYINIDIFILIHIYQYISINILLSISYYRYIYIYYNSVTTCNNSVILCYSFVTLIQIIENDKLSTIQTHSLHISIPTLYTFLHSLSFPIVQTNQNNTIPFVQLPQFPTFNPLNPIVYPDSAVLVQNDKALESAFIPCLVSVYSPIKKPLRSPPEAPERHIHFHLVPIQTNATPHIFYHDQMKLSHGQTTI